MAPKSKILRRTVLTGLGLACIAAAAALACTGTPCPEEQVVCASDGQLYCEYAPFGLKQLGRSCCPNAISPAAGPDASTEVAADAGEQADAGEPTGSDAALLPGPDAGEWDNCDNEEPPSSDSTEPRREGFDEAGVPYIYRCGQDICHPAEDAPPDAG